MCEARGRATEAEAAVCLAQARAQEARREAQELGAALATARAEAERLRGERSAAHQHAVNQASAVKLTTAVPSSEPAIGTDASPAAAAETVEEEAIHQANIAASSANKDEGGPVAEEQAVEEEEQSQLQPPPSLRTLGRMEVEEQRKQAVEASRRQAAAEREEARKRREALQAAAAAQGGKRGGAGVSNEAFAAAAGRQRQTPQPTFQAAQVEPVEPERHEPVTEEEMREQRITAREKLNNALIQFLPTKHVQRPGLASRMPGAYNKAAPQHELCNRLCSKECLCSSAAGFLRFFRVDVAEQPQMLRKELKKLASKYHPDKQRPEKVGAAKSALAQEACQVSTQLINLFEESEHSNVVVQVGEKKFVRINRVHEADSIRSLKLRVLEDEPDIAADINGFDVILNGNVLTEEAKATDAGLEEGVLLVVRRRQHQRAGRGEWSAFP